MDTTSGKSGGRSQEYVLSLNLLTRARREVIYVSKKLTSGTTAPRSGQYEIIGPRGGKTGTERTVVKGEPLPPVPTKGSTFKLVDPTKTK